MIFVSLHFVSLLVRFLLSHLLLNDLRLLSLSDPGLRSVDVRLCRIQFSHHLKNGLLLPHHLLNDLIEELV